MTDKAPAQHVSSKY